MPLRETLCSATLAPPGGMAPAGPRPAFAVNHHHAPIVALVALPASRLGASADAGGHVCLWSLGDGALEAAHRMPEGALPASLCAARGSLVCICLHGPSISVIDVITGAVCGRAAVALPVRLAAVSPMLTTLLVAGVDQLALVDLRSGETIATHELTGHEVEIRRVEPSLDGASFLVRFRHLEGDLVPASRDEAFDARTLAPLPASALASFSPIRPDGPLAGCSLTWQGASLTLSGRRAVLATLRGHGASVSVVARIPDSDALLSADDEGLVCRWNIDADLADPPRQLPGPVTGLSVSSEGLVLASSASRNDRVDVRLFADGACVTTFAAAGDVRFDDRDEHIVERGGDVVARERTGQERARVTMGHPLALVSADGAFGVAIRDHFPVRLFELSSGHETVFPPEAGGILSSSCPPIFADARTLVTFGYTSPARVFSLDPLRLVAERELHQHGTAWAQLDEDGETLWSVGCADGLVTACDLRTLSERRARRRSFEGAARTAALLRRRGELLVATEREIVKVGLGAGGTLRALLFSRVRAAALPRGARATEIVPGDDETTAIVFFENHPPLSVQVDAMLASAAEEGAAARASARRRLVDSHLAARHGLEKATLSADGSRLVGWRRGLLLRPFSLDGAAVAPPVQLVEIAGERDLASSALVGRSLLLLRRRDRALLRIDLSADNQGPTELGYFDGATSLLAAGEGRVAIVCQADRLVDATIIDRGGEVLGRFTRFAPGAEQLFVGGRWLLHPLDGGGLRVGDLSSFERRDLAPPAQAPASRLIAAAGDVAASLGGEAVLWKWDIREGRVVGGYVSPAPITALSVGPGGEVVVGDASGRVTQLR